MRLRDIGRLLAVLAIGWLASGSQPAAAQIDLSSILESAGPTSDPYSLSAQFTVPSANQPARLFVTVKLEPGWHIYSVTQPPPGPDGGPVRTKVSLDKDQPARLASEFQSIEPPKRYPEPAFHNLQVETHAGSVTWYAPLEFAPGIDPATAAIKGTVFVQACDAHNCMPPKNLAFTAMPGPGVSIPVAAPAAAAPVAAALRSPPAALGQAAEAPVRSHAKITGHIEPAVTPGGPARLLVTIAPEKGWHVYPLVRDNPPKIGKPTLLVLTSTGKLSASEPKADHAPLVRPSVAEPSKQTRYYEGPVTVSVDLSGVAGTKPEEVAGFLGFQTCKESACDSPEGLKFSGTLAGGPSTVRFQPARYIDAVRASGAGAGQASSAPGGFDASAVVVRDSSSAAKMSVWSAMLLGLVGGFILNFMPCVLPVIGLKILSFIEQSGHSRGRIFLLNVWYTLGMLSVFMVLAALAVFFEFGWGQLFTYSVFNIVLAAVVFTMALSFLGVWEVPLPGFVGTGKANELAARGGGSGAFFKGMITTILATPCSAPFLTSALVWSVKQPPALVFVLFGFIGLGMASPYLLIGAVPSLIRLLPRPGAWMDTFKQVMGFVLLGTVVYILALVPPALVVPAVAMLFGMWGACWWIGRTSLTADLPTKLRAWIEGLAFAALVGLFAFAPLTQWSGGWFRIGGLEEIMAARFNRNIERAVAQALVETKGSSESIAQRHPSAENADELPWQPFSEGRLVELTKAGKTVMVDFTADWCVTCKTLEYTVLNTTDVRQAVDANRITPLLADWTTVSEEIARMLDVLGGKELPVLAIFPASRPNEPIVLRGGYTKARLLEALREAGPSKTAATGRGNNMASR